MLDRSHTNLHKQKGSLGNPLGPIGGYARGQSLNARLKKPHGTAMPKAWFVNE